MTSLAWTLVAQREDELHADERTLVEAAQREPAALAELYRRHYPTIARYVLRRVGDQNEADDIVSEVFLCMARSIQRYRHRGIPFQYWLFRLANTQLSRWARSRRRWANAQLAARSECESAVDAQHSPDTEMIDLVLSTLPMRLQTVLSLHYLEEMKVVEIAQVLGCSAGTVKSRLSEGRELMRTRLARRGF